MEIILPLFCWSLSLSLTRWVIGIFDIMRLFTFNGSFLLRLISLEIRLDSLLTRKSFAFVGLMKSTVAEHSEHSKKWENIVQHQLHHLSQSAFDLTKSHKWLMSLCASTWGSEERHKRWTQLQLLNQHLMFLDEKRIQFSDDMNCFPFSWQATEVFHIKTEQNTTCRKYASNFHHWKRRERETRNSRMIYGFNKFPEFSSGSWIHSFCEHFNTSKYTRLCWQFRNALPTRVIVDVVRLFPLFVCCSFVVDLSALNTWTPQSRSMTNNSENEWKIIICICYAAIETTEEAQLRLISYFAVFKRCKSRPECDRQSLKDIFLCILYSALERIPVFSENV